MNECRASHSPTPRTDPPSPHTVRIASSLTSTSRPRARRVVPARPDTTTARRPRIVVDSVRLSHRRRRRRRRHRHRGAHATRLDSKRNERANERVHSDRARVRHSRACMRIIRNHPRGTTLTDHDSPPRDSIAIGGAADFARAIVISGRGCRFDESRPVVEPPTPDARDRSSRRSRGCARARMVSMFTVMTRGTMCKQ